MNLISELEAIKALVLQHNREKKRGNNSHQVDMLLIVLRVVYLVDKLSQEEANNLLELIKGIKDYDRINLNKIIDEVRTRYCTA